MGRMMNIDGEMKKKIAAARFMLWDGGDFMDQMQKFDGDESGIPELE
jgi:hypothetical protein